MGITERRLRQKDEVRSSILATAWQIVREEGWQALSIRKIADAIEYSVPVIYDHFENKEAILIEFAKDGYRILTKKFEQVRLKIPDPADQIRAIADTYWNFAFRNKEYYQVMFGLGICCNEQEKCIPEVVKFREHLEAPIVNMIERSKRTETSACLKGHTLWSILHGLISIKLMRNSDVCNELNKMVLDDAVNCFIKSLE